MTTATIEALTCSWCQEELDEQESADPRRNGKDGEIICDECYREHFEFTCQWCDCGDDKDREMAIGSLCVVLLPTPCDSYRYRSVKPHWLRIGDDYRWHMMPGVYRVVRWPVYGDNMLSSWLYADAFEWFSPLPDELKDDDEHWYHAGGLCRECQWKLKHAKWRKGWMGR